MTILRIRYLSRLLSGRGLGVVLALGATLLLSAEKFPKAMSFARVTADAFSGRPNPCWDLSATDTHSLIARCEALPSFTGFVGNPDEDQGLGYRGLKVSISSEPRFGQIFIGHGKVLVEAADSQEKRQLQDPERRLERWLLQTGQPHLDPNLYHYLLHEIGGASESPVP
jgi:hypothetical protein